MNNQRKRISSFLVIMYVLALILQNSSIPVRGSTLDTLEEFDRTSMIQIEILGEKTLFGINETLEMRAVLTESPMIPEFVVVHLSNGSHMISLELGSDIEGIYEGSIVLSSTYQTGQYTIEKVVLQSVEESVEIYSTGSEAGQLYADFGISFELLESAGEAESLSITDVQIRYSEPQNTPLKSGDTVFFSVHVEAGDLEIREGTLIYRDEREDFLEIPMVLSEGILTGSLNISEELNPGRYELMKVQVTDMEGHISELLSNPDAEPQEAWRTFGHMTFDVGTSREYPPMVYEVSVTNQVISPGQNAIISVSISTVEQVHNMTAYLEARLPDGSTYKNWLNLYNQDQAHIFYGELSITHLWDNAEYYLVDAVVDVGDEEIRSVPLNYDELLFTIEGSMQVIPFAEITVNKNELRSGDFLEMNVNILNDPSVYYSGSVNLTSQSSEERSTNLELTLYQISGNKYKAILPIHDYTPSGVYEVHSLVLYGQDRLIIVSDKSEEDTRYKQNFELATIEVKDTMVDHTAPLLKNISIESKEVFMGQDIVLHLDIEEHESGIKTGYAYFRSQYGNDLMGDIIREGENYSVRIRVPEFGPEDVYELDSVYVEDFAGLRNQVTNPKYMEGSYESPYNFDDFTVTTSFDRGDRVIFNDSDNILKGNSTFYLSGSFENLPSVRNSAALFYYETETGSIVEHQTRVLMDGSFYGEFPVKGNAEEGQYQLKKILVVADHSYIIEHGALEEKGVQDLSAGNYTVSDVVYDNQAPVLTEILLNKRVFSPGEKLQLTLLVEDDNRIKMSELLFYHPETNREFPIFASPDLSGVSRGSFVFPTTFSSGEWILRSVSLGDEFDNYKSVYNEKYTGHNPDNSILADLSAYSIRVVDTIEDIDAPEYRGSFVNKNTVNNLEDIEITIDAVDEISGIEHIGVMYKDHNGDLYYVGGSPNEDGLNIIKKNIFVPVDTVLVPQEIYLVDKLGNSISLTSKEVPLDHLKITVNAGDYIDVRGYVYDLISGQKIYQEGDIPRIALRMNYYEGLVQSAKIYYRYGEENTVFSLSSDQKFEGTFSFSLPVDHEHYKVNEQYEFIFMELTLTSGENLVIHTPWYPMSNAIQVLPNGHFEIVQDTFTIESFSLDNDVIASDGSVSMHLSTLMQDYDGYEVFFRVNSEPSSDSLRIKPGFEERFYADRYTLPGEYTIDFIRLFKKSGEYKTYYNRAYYPNRTQTMEWSSHQFSVTGTSGDALAPTVERMRVDRSTLGLHDIQTFRVKASDLGAGVDYGIVTLQNALGQELKEPVYLYYQTASDELVGAYLVTAATVEGRYKVLSLEVFDKAMNSRVIYNRYAFMDPKEGFFSEDLSTMDFEVTGTIWDTTPPEFNGFSFDEGTVHISNRKNLIIHAEDSDSGLQRIILTYESGEKEIVLESPIALWNGEYTATMDYSSSSDLWKLRKVEIYDKVGNRTTKYHSANPSGMLFMDLSFGNYTPADVSASPKIQQMTMDKQQLTSGEKVLVSVSLSNETVAPEKMEAIWKSSDGTQMKDTMLILQEDGSYEGEIVISPYDSDGWWNLHEVRIYDVFGKIHTIRKEGVEESLLSQWLAMSFEVGQTEPDTAPPELSDISLEKEQSIVARRMFTAMRMLLVQVPEKVEVTHGELVKYNVTAEDDVSGIEEMVLVYEVYNQKVTIKSSLTEQTSGTYTGMFLIENYHPEGEWRMFSVEVSDRAGNKKTLLRSPVTGTVPGYGKLNFSVKGTSSDRERPMIGEIFVSNLAPAMGDKVTYRVEASDHLSGIREVYITLNSMKLSANKKVLLVEKEPGLYEGDLVLTKDMPVDRWRIQSVTAVDRMGNTTERTNEKIGTSSLDTAENLDAYDITMRTEIGMELTTPDQTTYLLGDPFSVEGLEVWVLYDHGEKRLLGEDEYQMVIPDMTTTGEKTVTMKYKNFEKTYLIEVNQPGIKSVAITGSYKTEYLQGEELDLTGMTLEITYENDHKEVQSVNPLYMSGYDKDRIGAQTLTYKEGEWSAEVDITVLAPKLMSILITSMPSKKTYNLGEPLSIEGLQVMGIYSNETVKTLQIGMEHLSGLDSSSSEVNQVITITYEGKTATFQVEILEKVLTGITLIKTPSTLTYIEGQKLSLEGLVLQGAYSDSSQNIIPLEDILVEGYDASKLGKQTVTLTVEAKSVVFDVTVLKKMVDSIKVTSLPDKTMYFEAQAFEMKGLAVEATYNDGTVEGVELSMNHLTGFDSTKAVKDQIITITFEEKSAAFTVDILGKKDLKDEIKDLSETLSLERADELQKLMDSLEDTKEHKQFIEEFTAVLQEVRKIEKVDLSQTILEDEPQLTMSTDMLRKLNLPEVLEEDVVAVKVSLQSKPVPYELLEEVQKKVGKKENILLLYDMSLFKSVERNDGSTEESLISNEDIRGKLTLRIPVPESMEGIDALQIIYVTEDGKIEKLKTEEKMIDGVRYLYFETTHFSVYGITAQMDEQRPEASVQSSLPITGEMETTAFLFAGLLMMASGAFFLKKKTRRIS